MNRLFIAGCGYTGSIVSRMASDKGWHVTCHLREQEKSLKLSSDGFDTVIFQLDSIDGIPEIGRAHV